MDEGYACMSSDTEEIKECVENYWSKRAADFYKLREAELKSNKYIRWEQEIIPRLPAGRTLQILDVGCGTGFFSILLARHGHCVTGIDLTEEMVENAKMAAAKAGQQITFVQMDAEHLSFAAEHFDAVISRNLTWTLPNPGKAYMEWLRVLKPGGILLNYDAEYARDELYKKDAVHNAHETVPDDVLQECHKIYSMLAISQLHRPAWDAYVLAEIGNNICETDTDAGKRIYQEEDQFFIPVPMFGVYAAKK